MSHYSIGANVYNHKGKQITSIVGNQFADAYIERLDVDAITKPGLVPPAYRNRPDLIANLFLENPKSLWYLCLVSSKFDPFEDFEVNSRIRLPK